METRANYVLIGAFALAGFLGLLLFLMLFANVQLDRRYTNYDVRFTSISGLSRASEVRFEGLPVGQVVDVRLHPDMDGTILVRLEVDEETPLRIDSTATISALGVTGVSFVALSRGDPTQPLLRDTAEIPEITAGRAPLDIVFEDGPAILERVLEAVEQVNLILGAENRGRIDRILVNLETSSDGLAGALTDFAEVSQTIGTATTDIADFTTRMVPVAEGALATLDTVDETLAIYSELADRAQTSLDVTDATLEAARVVLETSDRFLGTDLTELANELTRTSAAVRGQVDALGGEAQDMFGTVNETAAEVTARLREAETAIAAITDLTERLGPLADAAGVTLGGIDTAVAEYTTLADDLRATARSAGPTLESAQRTLDRAGAFIDGDLALLTRDLTDTSALVRREVDTLGGEARQLMAGLAEAGTEATARLREAEETIARTDAMLAQLTGTLETVDGAAGRFDRMLDEDGAPLIAETRTMIASATEAVEAVSRAASDDLPAVMADVRSAARTATETVQTLGADISAASGRLDGVLLSAEDTLGQVGNTFANANDTLAAINRALEVGERTLAAAEGAFAGADRVINDELDGVISDLRRAMQSLDGAIAQVSDDIPAVTAGLREATEMANEAFQELGAVIAASGPAVRDFATQALPQYTQVGRETRALISSLERLLRQIERDPARFFLGRQTPEFRR